MSLHIHIARLATPSATLVQGLRLQIAPGTVHTLMGESGSGKSSVLAAVCGTLDADLQCEAEVAVQESLWGEILGDCAIVATVPFIGLVSKKPQTAE